MKIIKTNKYLKTKKQRINKVARSQCYSNKIEGVEVTKEKIKKWLR